MEQQIKISCLHVHRVVDQISWGGSHCTYWSPLLASTCCSIHWAAGRTASPPELALGNMPLCHYRPGRHLLFASQCADSSQAARTQREGKIYCSHQINKERGSVNFVLYTLILIPNNHFFSVLKKPKVDFFLFFVSFYYSLLVSFLFSFTISLLENTKYICSQFIPGRVETACRP